MPKRSDMYSRKRSRKANKRSAKLIPSHTKKNGVIVDSYCSKKGYIITPGKTYADGREVKAHCIYAIHKYNEIVKNKKKQRLEKLQKIASSISSISSSIENNKAPSVEVVQNVIEGLNDSRKFRRCRTKFRKDGR